MHDQRKGTREELSGEEQTALQRKIASFKALYADCYARRDAKCTDRACLAPQQELLTQNPECFAMWSHRRRVYAALWDEERVALLRAADEPAAATDGLTPVGPEGLSAAMAGDDPRRFPATGGLPPVQFQDLMAELKFNTAVIKRDYKCYAAWTHRRWIMDQLSPGLRVKVLTEENAKLEELLRADERNFHAWGYRRWVVTQLEALGAYTHARDLAFAEAKIMQNFSNYSAWHNRAIVTSRMIREATAPSEAAGSSGGGGDGGEAATAAAAAAVKAVLETDVEMVVRSFYTDPADQSAWMYVPALLQYLRALTENAADAGVGVDADGGGGGGGGCDWAAMRTNVVGRLLNAAYELAQDDMAGDPRAVKWPLWLVVTLAAEGHVELAKRPLKLASSDDAKDLVDSLAAGWLALARIDPLRRGYFNERARRSAS